MRLTILPLAGLCVMLLPTLAQAKSHQATAGERAPIVAAVKSYVRKGGMTSVKVERVLVDGSYARAAVIPSVPTDTATVYLKHQGRVWRVLTLGTGFAPGDLNRMGIPKSLR